MDEEIERLALAAANNEKLSDNDEKTAQVVDSETDHQEHV